MVRNALTVVLLAASAASGQLDTERWLRGELNPTQRKRPFIATPELKVTPETRAESADGKCSIPLKEVNPPDPNARIKVFPVPPSTRNKFHMRFLKPPAPPCDQADQRAPEPPSKPEQKK